MANRPVRQCHDRARRRAAGRASHRSAGARPRRVRRQQEDQGQGTRRDRRIQAARHAAARHGAVRRRPHHGSLPPCRPRRCRRGAQDHRSRQRPRRPRLRGDGGAEDHGAADRFRRQHGLRQAAARRRDQDLRHQHAELPDRRRRLRSRPRRRRSRGAAAVLPQQGLCRCQRDLGQGRIRSGAARIYADVRDRRRPALSFRRHQRRLQRAGAGWREASPLAGGAAGRGVRRQRARQDHRRCWRSSCQSSAFPSRRPPRASPATPRHDGSTSPSRSTRGRGPMSSASISTAIPAPAAM